MKRENKTIKMDYNSQLIPIKLPEYGRTIQKMVDYCMQLEDREQRNLCAKTIVKIMAHLHPNTSNSQHYEQKLWDHLFMMSDYKLDIDAPYPKPNPAEIQQKPQILGYNNNKVAFRYYGKNVESIIKVLDKVDNPEEKDYYVLVTANYMKKLQNMWNKEAHIKDEVVFEHLKKLSEGNIVLTTETTQLDHHHHHHNNNKSQKKKFNNKPNKKNRYNNGRNH